MECVVECLECVVGKWKEQSEQIDHSSMVPFPIFACLENRPSYFNEYVYVGTCEYL